MYCFSYWLILSLLIYFFSGGSFSSIRKIKGSLTSFSTYFVQKEKDVNEPLVRFIMTSVSGFEHSKINNLRLNSQ